MKTLRSYVRGEFHTASEGFVPLVDPSTEAEIAQASSAGIDFAGMLAHAREAGGPALRKMTFAERGQLLQGLREALQAHRDELLDLSMTNTGVTRKDAKFDVDGAMATLGYYAYLGSELGDRRVLLDGDGIKLGRSARFWGQHVRAPLDGVAVHINAFNFPAWGFAEKAACALLAGMPVISKPATSSAMVAERCFEILVGAELLPAGTFQTIVGRTGDLLSLLTGQDVVAFTGSANTAFRLRREDALMASNARMNVEADSLNAAVLGPDIEEGSDVWHLFLKDVVREIVQKSGQKCTAVRRIFVPAACVADVQAELIERLSETVTGAPSDDTVTMGPLNTSDQLADAITGVQELLKDAEIVHGTGARVDGVGADAGKGFFFAPTLLRANDLNATAAVHNREVFGPVATILPYDGKAATAAHHVARAEGTLVTSVYCDDLEWVGEFIAEGGTYQGRLYLGSEKMAEQATGSGLVLPQSVHGGPGRAGGGTELGGLAGLELYTQRIALQGSRFMIDKLYGAPKDAAE